MCHWVHLLSWEHMYANNSIIHILTHPAVMKNLHFSFAALFVLVLSSFTSNAPSSSKPTMSATDYLLKLDGIKGESKDGRHIDEIIIESYSFNTAAKSVSIERFKSPIASPKIQEACSTGRLIKKAVLYVRKSPSSTEFLEYELENVLITSYQLSGSSSRPMESFSLNWERIRY